MTSELLFPAAEFAIPKAHSCQRDALKSVVKQILSTYLSGNELCCLVTYLRAGGQIGLGPIDLPGESTQDAISQIVEVCDEKDFLRPLVGYIRHIKPAPWRERIGPLVHPRFYLPACDSAFVGRREECLQVLDILLNPSSEKKAVIIKGVNGIGKTALAQEVAYLCKKYEVFEDIWWLSIRSGRLKYMDEPFTWSEWLRSQNTTFGWEMEKLVTDGVRPSGFDAMCWEKIRDGHFLLCIDGLDRPEEHENLGDFLQSIGDSKCRVIITTAQDFKIKSGCDISLRGWGAKKTTLWLRKAGLLGGISRLIDAKDSDMESLCKETGGIPLALIWRVAQMETDDLVFDNLHLQSLSDQDLLEKIFQASYESLDEPAKRLLFALSIFDWPVSLAAWEYTTEGNKERHAAKSCTESASESHVGKLKRLSLIEYDDEHKHYFLLSITREFLAKQRDENHKLIQELCKNWLDYYRMLSTSSGMKNRRGYNNLVADWPNLWQAVQYALDQWTQFTQQSPLTREGKKWGRTLISFGNALTDFCRVHGHWNEQLELCCAAAKAAADMPGSLEHLGPLAYTVGWIYCNRKELERAQAWAKWAEDALETSKQGKGYALRLFAYIEQTRVGSSLTTTHSSYKIILDYLEEAKEVFRETDQKGLARTESDLGLLAYDCGEYSTARTHHTEALSIFRDLDDYEGISATWVNLGDIDVKEKKFRQAEDCYQKAQKFATSPDIVEILADAERGLADARLGIFLRMKPNERKLHLPHVRDLARAAYTTLHNLGIWSTVKRTEKLLCRIKQELNEEVNPQEDRGKATNISAVAKGSEKKTLKADTQLGGILIVTVTRVEAQAVLNVFSQAAGTGWTRQVIGKKTYYNLGTHGSVPVFMVQSEMGIATLGGALLTVRQAIQDLQPQAVIMCGIAFGLRPDKQQLGDILVAKRILYYEPQKVDMQRGQMPRGDRVTSAGRLLDRFRSGDLDWQGVSRHFGLVLSGEKLVNDPTFRDWLLETEPEAIGGEMEGAGLYVAARDAQVDWILVKAICDWADGEKNDDAHLLAASNAAQFVLHVLQLGGWGEAEQLPVDKDSGKETLKEQSNSKRRENNMVTPAAQLGAGILLESVKFLFAELGRRLEFWRKKKGETQPENIADAAIVEQDEGKIALQLDDVVHPITVSALQMVEDRIKTSLDILQDHSTTLDTYRKRLTNPLILPNEEAFCNQEIPKLERAIEEESNQLQELVERVLA